MKQLGEESLLKPQHGGFIHSGQTMFLPAPPPLCGCGPGCCALLCWLVSCNEISEIICPITRRWVARGLLMVSLCPALPVHCIFDKNLIPGGGERRGGGLSWGTGRDYHGTPRLVAWIALIKGTSTFSIVVPSPSDTTHLGRKRK